MSLKWSHHYAAKRSSYSQGPNDGKGHTGHATARKYHPQTEEGQQQFEDILIRLDMERRWATRLNIRSLEEIHNDGFRNFILATLVAKPATSHLVSVIDFVPIYILDKTADIFNAMLACANTTDKTEFTESVKNIKAKLCSITDKYYGVVKILLHQALLSKQVDRDTAKVIILGLEDANVSSAETKDLADSAKIKDFTKFLKVGFIPPHRTGPSLGYAHGRLLPKAEEVSRRTTIGSTRSVVMTKPPMPIGTVLR